MTVLTAAQVREVMTEVLVADPSLGTWSRKADVQAAVEAADRIAETVTPMLDQALPEPWRSRATTAQKSRLYALLAMKRGG